jgi:hypothetical protein
MPTHMHVDECWSGVKWPTHFAHQSVADSGTDLFGPWYFKTFFGLVCMSKSCAPLLLAIPCLGAGAVRGPELQAASKWWKLLQALSHEVAAHLGLQLGAIRIKRFADGEIYVQVLESIRGCDVFLLQATCPTQTASVNDSLMELMVMVDACRCAQPSAGSITVAPFVILSHKFFMLCAPWGLSRELRFGRQATRRG